MLRFVLGPLRRRRAIRALAARSAAADALRQAKVRGDTRLQHEAQVRLTAATTDLLRAELAMGR